MGSQYGEDKIIESLLDGESKIYVDIGAGHPIINSNTWNLYQKGWRGLLVDCGSQNWYLLLKMRPGDFLCPLAVSNKTGIANFHIFEPDCGVNSLLPNWNQGNEIITVECDTFENILKPFPEIRKNCSLLSIDVEGVEDLVLSGIDFTLFCPKVLIIEFFRFPKNWDGNPFEDLSANWSHFVLDSYTLYQTTTTNHIYLRK
jgi:FkbM family methyltransferase